MGELLGRDTDPTLDLRSETIEIPEHNLSVRLMQLESWQLIEINKDGQEATMLKAAAWMVVNADGERQYASPEGVAKFIRFPASITAPIVAVVGKLNGTSPEAIEETTKNSEASQTNEPVSV